MASRMNQESRQSFFRANHATVVGSDKCWFIRLAWVEPYNIFKRATDNSWWVEADNSPVSYSSSYAAIQAIKRVRPDLPWSLLESKPSPKLAALASTTSEARENISAPAVKSTAEDGNRTAQEAPQKELRASTSVGNEFSRDRLNEMALAAWAISELGHAPSTPEELNHVLERIKELRDEKM